MAQESSAPKLHTTVTVKKYDHEKEGPPELVETVTMRDGQVITRESHVTT